MMIYVSLAVLIVAIPGCLNEQNKTGKTMKTAEIALTDANFDTEAGNGVVLIDFWAPWCAPCMMQGPIIEKVAKAMSGKAKVGKCNVDDAPKLAERFGIRSIPTLVILKDNQEVERFVGVQQEADLVSSLKKQIK